MLRQSSEHHPQLTFIPGFQDDTKPTGAPEMLGKRLIQCNSQSYEQSYSTASLLVCKTLQRGVVQTAGVLVLYPLSLTSGQV